MNYTINPTVNGDYPINYPLYLVQLDTFKGFSFKIQLNYDNPPQYLDLTGATAEMQIRATPTSPVLLDLSTANSGITISSPYQGLVVINPFKITITPSLNPYVYDIPVTLADGVTTYTYIGGLVYVKAKVTHV